MDINKNDYPAYFYLAANVGYDINDNVNAFVKVDNVFNTDPPYLAGNTIIRAQAAGTAGYYDQIGRAFVVGVRLRY
jgi:outer membrane receptor protein involved in Fe transport